MHVPDGSYHKPALPKKSHYCQALLLRWVASAANNRHPIQPAKEAPAYGGGTTTHNLRGTEPTRSRDILATAAKNQPEDGPSTRRAAIRACKYLRAMLTNMVPNFRQCVMPRKYMHNAAEEAQQLKRPTVGRRRVNSPW